MGKKEQRRGATAGGNPSPSPQDGVGALAQVADRPEVATAPAELSPEQKAALLKTIRDENARTAKELRESLLRPVDMTAYGALLEETYFG